MAGCGSPWIFHLNQWKQSSALHQVLNLCGSLSDKWLYCLGGIDWSLCLKLGMGGEVVKTLNSSITGAFVLFFFSILIFFFFPPLSLAPEKQISLYLCVAGTDAMRGEASDIGVRGNLLESKKEGDLSCFGCIKIQGNNQKQWPLHWSWLWPLWSTHHTEMVPVCFGDAMRPFGF